MLLRARKSIQWSTGLQTTNEGRWSWTRKQQFWWTSLSIGSKSTMKSTTSTVTFRTLLTATRSTRLIPFPPRGCSLLFVLLWDAVAFDLMPSDLIESNFVSFADGMFRSSQQRLFPDYWSDVLTCGHGPSSTQQRLFVRTGGGSRDLERWPWTATTISHHQLWWLCSSAFFFFQIYAQNAKTIEGPTPIRSMNAPESADSLTTSLTD